LFGRSSADLCNRFGLRKKLCADLIGLFERIILRKKHKEEKPNRATSREVKRLSSMTTLVD
jgi:hypothetical protein